MESSVLLRVDLDVSLIDLALACTELALVIFIFNPLSLVNFIVCLQIILAVIALKIG
jgi:hypothetical protein